MAILTLAAKDLRLLVRDADDRAKIERFGEIVTGDITDLDRMKVVCKDVDTVLHLAASASPSTAWDDALSLNIVGTYNTFVAAKAAKCRRLISVVLIASWIRSIRSVIGWPPAVAWAAVRRLPRAQRGARRHSRRRHPRR